MSLAVHNEIIRPRDLPRETGLSRTTIWRMEKIGDFPKRIRLSAGAVGYLRTSVEAWRANRQTVVED
jgi:prophage regulatory protein